MEWKKFLSPTKKKIILFLIFLVRFVYVIITEKIASLWSEAIGVLIFMFYLPVFILRSIVCLPFMVFINGDYCPFDVGNPLFTFIERIIDLIWTYILVCILFYKKQFRTVPKPPIEKSHTKW